MSGSKPSFRFTGKRRELLDALRREQGPAGEASRRIPRRDGSGAAPLSFAQQRLWFLDQLEPGSAAYNLAAALGLRGRLDVPALAAALRGLALRHEALRTTFPSVDEEPVQAVAAEPRTALPLVDLGGLGDDEAEAEAERIALDEAVRPFDLAAGPLLRSILVRRSGEDHRLVVVLHHIVADGWSRGILLREVGELYSAASEGREPRLPELPIQYADYAVWQRGRLQGEALGELLDFWRGRLAGSTPLDLPADRPRPAAPSGRGGQRPVHLSLELAERLRTLAHGAEATLFMVLLAGWDALLLRHGSAPDVAVGAPVANRDRAETAGLIGFFVNTLVLRADLSDDPAFGDLLARVRRETLEALARQEVPFEKLVEELQPDRDLGRQPLFQVMLALLPAAPEPPRWGDLGVDVRELPTGTAKVDLLLALEEGPEGVAGTCEHSADLFDEVTVDRLLARLEVLLESAADDPSRRISELNLLPAAELLQILADAETPDLTEESVDEAEVCLHTLVALQAARTPDAVAVEGAGECVTYRELASRAARLADHLRDLGVGPEVPVAVCLERSPDLVVAVLAVLEAGGAYVPIDPAYPRDRQAYILAQAGAPVLLTQERLLSTLPAGEGVLPVLLDALDAPLPPPRDIRAEAGPRPVADNLAYVLYTSGSTGRPKGVAVRHRSAVALVRWARQLLPADDLSAVLAATSVCFDLSVFELFVPLASGGRVVLAENALALPALRDAGVRLVNTVPSAIAELLRTGGIPESVRTINLAGEPLPPGLAARLYELPHVERVYNLYGPTEDTTYSTASLVPRGAARVSIGRPLPGTRAHVLDRRLRQAPAGVPGELYLGGAGLARGYLGRPDLTAERFVPDPFAGPDQPGRRLYRTGDLVRTLRDGSLEFLGRLDHQVKVRGFRIELGEIEEVLRSHPAMRDCAVLAREDRPGEMRLVAYAAMAADRPEGWSELRALLASRLPEYMIPAAFVRLDALPLTPSGKVDRKALPAPVLAAADRPDWEAPRSPLEELVAGCWADLLGVQRVGLRDNFFDLGGHSLLAARVVARLRAQLGAELPVRALFEEPTVAGIAARIEAARGTRTALPPLRRFDRLEAPPLSFAQERLWFLSELEPGSPLYNLPAAIRLRGTLDPAALAGALRTVVRRHEALRTAFHESGGGPVQAVAPDLDLRLPLVDLSALPMDRREPEAARLRSEEARRGFDLGTLPLVRAALQRLDEGDHVLALNLHHAVADGWSLGVLAREIRELLDAAASGRPATLPELPVQYADYAVWQRGWLHGEALEALLEPWRRRLAGAPGLLPLPTDRPRTALTRRRGSSLPVELPGGLSARVEEVARRSGATPFMVLLAAFQVLLGRTAGEDDVSVGFPVANRGQAELEGLIGFFVNTLVLRTRMDGEPGFAGVLARVREAALDALAYQDLPFERLVEELRPGRDLGHTPLFQVMFVLQNTPPRGADPAGLELSEVDIDTGAARFDLTLTLAPGALADTGWHGRLSFDRDLFDAVTVRRLSGRFERLLEAAVRDPEQPVAGLPLLAPAELHQVLREWNDASDAGAAEGCLHERFEVWARRRPDAPAVVGEDGVLTWRELDQWANGLAHGLSALGVGPESRVALCAERSAAMIAGLLAILKAGAAYVPLDPSYPRERLAGLLEDCGAAALVAHRHLAGLLEDTGLPALLLEGERLVADAPPPAGALPESPAYVIYTSGSTGRPKGVVVEHRQAVNYLRGAAARLELEELPPGTAYATVSTLAADLGNTVVFASLALGGVLHVIPRERVADAEGLGGWFEEHGIDVLKIVPSHLAALLTGERPERVPPRRRLILGGERSESAWVEGLRALAPECRIFNHYGPTETTVGVIAGRAGLFGGGAGSLPLGRPLAGSRILLLDRDLRPVPAGVPGGLYVAGAGLARGYLGRPDLTAERFIPNPLAIEAGERLYATGDLARSLPDGRIEFLGRVDDQVKIRGYRVEPGEVEAALAALPAVREAAVLARTSPAGEVRLVAWVVPAGPGLTAPELRAALARTLPEALVPAAFVFLDALPLTPNGKLDRRALPAPPEEAEEPVSDAAPRTALEELLAASWAELLGRSRVGVHDDFFDLGGHSLLATRAISRARSIAGWTVPLHALFEARTVAGLARWIAQSRGEGGGAPAAPPLEPAADGSPAPLSFAQERLWFLDQLEPGSALYNLPYFARVEGPLDAGALERALGETVRRHEALRTVFPVREGAPVQEVLPSASLPLPAIDLSRLSPERRRAEARRLMDFEARRPFDLERGPMARASLVRLGEEDHLLLLSLHHIVSDAWSRTVLTRELAALYAGSTLPPLPVQYGDFARWQRSWLRGEALEARLAWWRERLEGAPAALQLPWDRPLSGRQRWTGATVPFALPPDLAGSLEERARREGVTLFMLLLGVFQILLHRVSAQDDVVVGTAVAGRDRSELEGLVGFFVNALPLRARFADEPELAAHLAAVRETALGAYAHQDLPFEKLVEALGADRAAGLPPVFQVVFALQNVPKSTADLGGAALQPLAVHTGTAKFPLTLSLAPAGGGLAGAAELAAELFDTATVERLLGGFRAALESVAAGAAGRVGDLPLLGEAERRQLLEGSAASLPADLDLLDLFEIQVDTRPDAVAVACGDERLTWADLDRRANRLAHRLIALGAGPEVAVGLALERSAELVTAILATVKAGGFYVPLDPSLPQERLELLAARAGVRIALARDEATAARLASTGAAVLAPEGEGPEHRPGRRAVGSNLLYVMYTSGSTGEPKGVAVTRANVLRLVWDTDYCRFAPDEVFLLLAPVAFDASTFELWGALSSGARLAVMPGGAFTLHELERAVLDHGVTTLWLTAGLFHQVVDERPEILRPLRQLLAGGDVLSPEHVRRALEIAPACRLINGYGPTEGTTFTTCHTVERGRELATVPIGRPIARTSVRVLDRYGVLVPAGVPGELYAGGGGLARGYLGRPDLTAERFVPDPFGGAGERLYRTGDLVRRRPDGEIEFLGRIDGQVKLRGFRIEPGEIEAALVRHPAVREAVVLAREERPGDCRLVAWVVPEGVAPDADELRAFLRDRLPAYMMPSAFVALDSLPLTPNGKVDRRALPAPVEARKEQAAAAPRTPMEELVAGHFADVLGVRDVGAGDDFFALGGHSLLATRLLARVRDSLGAEVPLRDLFEAPTVEAFAARVDAALTAEHGEPEPPSCRHEDGDAPLSFAQQRLWFLDQLEPGSPLYNIAFAVRAHGPLRPEVLEASLAEVVRRHDALRTVFPEREGEPRQVVLPAVGLRLPVVDLGGLGEEQSAAEALRLTRAEAVRPFDLARGPLLRSLLLRVGADRHWLVTAVHHIVFDGWSIGVLTGEMAALYEAFEEGRPAPLPGLPLQYADFAAWQRRWLEGERLETQAAWWRRQLGGSAPAELPGDRPRPAVRDLRGAALSTTLSSRETAALQDLARRRGATLFMVLLAALQALVRRHGGPRDAAMGSPIAGRRYRDLEGLIGFFVNTLVLRQELPEDSPFDSLVERAKEVCLDAYRHQDVPFERVVEETHPERDLSRTPLFQILFALQSAPGADLRLGDLTLAPVELEGGDTGTAKFDLQLTAAPQDGGLDLTWTFATSLYDGATIRRLAAGFRALLRAVAAEPGLVLEDLPLLGEAERHQILVEWNDTALPRPHETGPELLHELFLEQAGRTPSAVALAHGDERLTYRELAERSARLAVRLRALGAGPERRVGVCLGRTPDLVIALLAVLRSGAAYVPLDPAYPQERLEGMLGDSRAEVLLTETALASRLAGLAPSVLTVDGDLSGEEPWTPLPIDPGNLAYVIYTSGSTGRPKGVAIEHRAAVAFVRWALSVFEAEDFAGVLAATSICFDLSVFELFAPLARGGRVILADNALALPATSGVRLVNTVPSAMAELLRGGGLPPSVRTVNLAGEALPAPLARDLHALGVRVFNLYGPTEDTTYSTGVRLEPGDERPPTIGRPIAGGRAFVLDSALRPAPLGAPGEVWLGGAGLARGYLGRPDLTAERFLPDPHAVEPGARLYRTGDLARLLPDGRLDYLGRTDHQVKIRGFRIELGEVEAMLAEHPEVEEAAVLAEADRSGTRRLVAWAVPRTDAAPVPAEILAWLRQRLPAHAVPSRLGLLEEMPRTLNGKTDRRALARLEAALPAADDRVPSAPRSVEEEILAGIWQDVLGIERVGLHDSFFDLGGHSLLATRVTSRLREAFGVEVPLLWLFEAPTVAALAERLSRARSERPAPPLRPVSRGGRLAVSFAQERIWFLDRLDEGSSAYLLPGVLRLRGRLDEAALEIAWAEILRRHEGLRTVFPAFDGRPEPIVLPAPPVSLARVDLRALLPDAVRAETDRSLRELARRPMDLDKGPLWRTALLRVGDEERLFAFTLHHVVADGWSLGILVNELTELYRAFAERRPSPLPEPALQYADYAAWQRSWLEGDVLAGQLAWWREQLAGAPEALALPTDRPRPGALAPAGGKVAVNVSAADGRALRDLGRRHGATAFMVLLAALQSVLARHSGDEDLCIGTPIANRNRAESEGLIGCLVNTLVLRGDLAGDPTFASLLSRTRRMALGAYDHQDLPFERLVDELCPRRNLGRTPLFQVMLALQPAARAGAGLPGLDVEPIETETGASKFDLSLSLTDLGDAGISGSLHFNAALFDRATVERLTCHLLALLRAASADPALRLSELEMLPPAERHQVLVESNDTDRAGEPGLLPDLFAAVAARNPEAPAVLFAGERLTYRELDLWSNRVAQRLARLGVGPDVRVGLCLERSPEWLVCALGILKAGGAYLPLSPADPAERMAWILEDAGASVLISRERLTGGLQETGVVRICLDRDREAIAGESPEALKRDLDPAGLAYVLYTSGSTGRPKGVAVHHRGLAWYLRWIGGVLEQAGVRTLPAISPLTFDASLKQLFSPLVRGEAVLLLGDDEALDPDAVQAALASRDGQAGINCVPALLDALLAGWPAEGLSLRAALIGGEALGRDLADRLFERVPGVELWNLYGPTEVTSNAVAGRVASGEEPSIGCPVDGIRAYVLDRGLRLAPLGAVGQLYLAGAGVARGYLARPDLTAAAFMPDPFSGEPGGRLYATGDLVRRLADGRLRFAGRADGQVKIRGVRIEPGEIEAALAAHPAVREAVVGVHGKAPGARLVAWWVASDGSAPADPELLAFLRGRLPEALVPSAFVRIADMPRTPHGKVDHRRLPEPAAESSSRQAYEAPRTPTEEILAGLWAELLGRDRVGVHDNFFELGGHSLLATQLVSRARLAFQIENLPLRSLFQHPTVRDLSLVITQMQAAEEDGAEMAQLLEELKGLSPEDLSLLLDEELTNGTEPI